MGGDRPGGDDVHLVPDDLERAVGCFFVHVIIDVTTCSDFLGYWVLRVDCNGARCEDVVRFVRWVFDLSNRDFVIRKPFVLTDDVICGEEGCSESA